MKNIFDTVADLLLTNDKYKAEDGKLLKAVVYSDVMAMNENLLQLLLSNEDVKTTFFKDVQGTLVFDKQKFAWFLESREFLPDSYTAYTNKIGLTHNGNFISQTNDVVLDFPYKDCVLEGGQDKNNQKRDEIFYNETIASDEISRMLAPKVFTNAKRYTAVVEKDLTGNLDPDTIHIEEETGITLNDADNLIIKGNNLIALASLLKRYEGKVKCIYIDPPYNTQNDSFNYNDSFNHSTWLTFMKNRLELAKKLLSDYGTIFISLDDKEDHYCKVLADDIFGRENFIADICHKSRASISNDKIISPNHNHVLFYAKSERNIFSIKNQYGISKDLSTFKEKDELGYYKLVPVDGPGGAAKGNPYYEFLGIKNYWRFSKKTMTEMYNQGLIVKKGKSLQQKYYKSRAAESKQTITTWWDEGYLTSSATGELNKLIDKKFSNPKNESLLELIIEFATQEHDLVLDFNLGSGTTAAVAHKMGRHYIGVEQMDYIEDVTVARLKKVLEGEQGGISKAQNWTGGGSFVYCELKEDANTLIESIQNATEETIDDVKAFIYADDRIVPYLTKKELADADEDFESLTLEDKKKALITLVDKNKLYVNASDMDDENYHVSDVDKAFTKSFYEEV